MSLRLGQINDYDLAAVNNFANEAKSRGFFAEADLSKKCAGEIRLCLDNYFSSRDGLLVVGIVKLVKRRLGVFPVRVWLGNIQTADALSPLPRERGTVVASTLVFRV